MSDLTFEQVKKAGRFAWHDESRFVFADGAVYSYPWHSHQPGEDWERFDSESADPALVNVVVFGVWHHLPGCDCEFCRADSASVSEVVR